MELCFQEKSSIFTGIAVGLGDSNGEIGLKSLIKDSGENEVIILEIENSFSNPFNPEIYEKSVIIERRIFHNGISFYFIRNETGTIIFLEESVLKSILQHFSIFGLIVLPGSKSKSFSMTAQMGKGFRFWKVCKFCQ